MIVWGCLTVIVAAGLLPAGDAIEDDAVRAFLEAGSPAQARKRAKKVLESGADFETVWRLLRTGRSYSSDIETGRLDLRRWGWNTVEYHYTVLIPEEYAPDQRYPVHVYLHGGVSGPAWQRGGAWWRDYLRGRQTRRRAGGLASCVRRTRVEVS